MSKRILVVEDQPDNRQIIRDMLAPTDYEITEAENGEEALAAITGRSQTRGLVQCTNVMASLAPAARSRTSSGTSNVRMCRSVSAKSLRVSKAHPQCSQQSHRNIKSAEWPRAANCPHAHA